MTLKLLSILAFILVSCMPYTITHKYVKRTDGYGHGHRDLSLYSSIDFNKKYNKMAQIKIKHNVIHGELKYDNKMKEFLLQAINNFNGCAIINNENLADDKFYYFDIVSLPNHCKIKNNISKSTPSIE